jgi:UBX domain-containing protein 1
MLVRFCVCSCSSPGTKHCRPQLNPPVAPRAARAAGSGQLVKEPKSAKEAAEAILKMQGVQGEGAKAHLVILLWKNGYQVEEGGDLQSYESKEGMAFMTYILQGRVPPSLITPERAEAMKTGALDVQIQDRRKEDAPPPPSVRIFKGASHVVGSAAPAVATAVVLDSAGGPPPACDEGRPHTTVQIKLADGKKLALKINLTGTVADLQRAAAGAHATGGKPFVLKAGFPPKVLDVPCATIEAAALQGASISQVLA